MITDEGDAIEFVSAAVREDKTGNDKANNNSSAPLRRFFSCS
jgi:hypothetical protein